jgi:hypothetical protein
MAILPPAIQQSVQIVDPQTGMMTSYYSDWLNRILNSIITQTNSNTALIAALQSQQASIIALQAQLVSVQQAQNGASGKSGSASLLGGALGSVWTNGPVVSLTGVTAGNLTFPGSGPTQGNSTVVNPGGGQGSFVGNWRIVEIISAVETTVFTGTYAAQRLRDDGSTPFTSVLYNTTDTSAVVPRTTTGAMDYRLDLQAHDATRGDFEVDASPLALYVNRS